jgi:DNA-directed RNA polymerase specialized sigma24 family protein
VTTEPTVVSAREQDLVDALAALVRHYKRHTTHRCEILADAEDVLAGLPYPRIVTGEE